MIELTDVSMLAEVNLLTGLLIMMAVFYFVMIWGGHKDKKKHRDMLAAIKRNDRVMTVGGIMGTVLDVSDRVVTLKVDESANVKMKFSRGSIQRVFAEGEEPDDVQT